MLRSYLCCVAFCLFCFVLTSKNCSYTVTGKVKKHVAKDRMTPLNILAEYGPKNLLVPLWKTNEIFHTLKLMRRAIIAFNDVVISRCKHLAELIPESMHWNPRDELAWNLAKTERMTTTNSYCLPLWQVSGHVHTTAKILKILLELIVIRYQTAALLVWNPKGVFWCQSRFLEF